METSEQRDWVTWKKNVARMAAKEKRLTFYTLVRMKEHSVGQQLANSVSTSFNSQLTEMLYC